ncbi:LSU ribosomal protein L15p (L27Ae), mitochondrial [Actinacidiphila bryophytorum]|uniref:LSU ribosomal protein L15p (L27Ae), mitochondrial n=1 Tax=Actinacidiphila bryophytorum TaxID=1436133 RepID=A0A9W4GZL3_9ACTN|nr:LSU ribosomal protein L15p (L27Ae), mitochondrial [Actinacidiphila bryophytorum]
MKGDLPYSSHDAGAPRRQRIALRPTPAPARPRLPDTGRRTARRGALAPVGGRGRSPRPPRPRIAISWF